MSIARPTTPTGHTRHWLSATGLLPLARQALRLYTDLQCASRGHFRLAIDGTEVSFHTSDAYSSRFFHRRYRNGELHEPPVTAELARRVKGARVFADVGAHIAYYSCVAGALNRRLRLFLFEMNRDLVPAIERNLRENGLSDAVVVSQPVADRRRVVGYAEASGEPGLTMRDAAGGDAAGQVLVETVTLDEFFAEQATWPDLIKIDVEGAEYEVLQGARGIIAQHHPVMFVEVHPRKLGDFGASIEQVYSFLRDHRYTLQRFVGHRSNLTGLEPIAATAAAPEGTHMLLCV